MSTTPGYYPKYFRKISFRLINIIIATVLSHLPDAEIWASNRKASEGSDVVKGKIYPKSQRLEINPNLGFVLNQSYVQTILLSLGGAYYMNENWGIGLDFSTAQNSDKVERLCIESFFNDPVNEVTENCGGPELLDDAKKANYGPAYVPIREINSIIMANIIWNPVYGKQLFFMSATSYFDLYLELGLGIVSSTFYPKKDRLRNGNISRGEFLADGSQPQSPLGYNPKDGDPISYGEEGRPDKEAGTNPVLNIGIGQKFHFLNNFHIKVYLRNMTILGSQSGFENLFALSTGIGLRF